MGSGIRLSCCRGAYLVSSSYWGALWASSFLSRHYLSEEQAVGGRGGTAAPGDVRGITLAAASTGLPAVMISLTKRTKMSPIYHLRLVTGWIDQARVADEVERGAGGSANGIFRWLLASGTHRCKRLWFHAASRFVRMSRTTWRRTSRIREAVFFFLIQPSLSSIFSLSSSSHDARACGAPLT